jgi:hypothetical protein
VSCFKRPMPKGVSQTSATPVFQDSEYQGQEGPEMPSIPGFAAAVVGYPTGPEALSVV